MREDSSFHVCSSEERERDIQKERQKEGNKEGWNEKKR